MRRDVAALRVRDEIHLLRPGRLEDGVNVVGQLRDEVEERAHSVQPRQEIGVVEDLRMDLLDHIIEDILDLVADAHARS